MIRRAPRDWTAMACVDNDFCDIEQMGLRALCERFATLHVKTVVTRNPNLLDD